MKRFVRMLVGSIVVLGLALIVIVGLFRHSVERAMTGGAAQSMLSPTAVLRETTYFGIAHQPSGYKPVADVMHVPKLHNLMYVSRDMSSTLMLVGQDQSAGMIDDPNVPGIPDFTVRHCDANVALRAAGRDVSLCVLRRTGTPQSMLANAADVSEAIVLRSPIRKIFLLAHGRGTALDQRAQAAYSDLVRQVLNADSDLHQPT